MIIHQHYEKACSHFSPDIKTLKRFNTSSTTVSEFDPVEDDSAPLDFPSGKDCAGQLFGGTFLMQVKDDGANQRFVHSKLLKHFIKSTKKAQRICRRSLRLSSSLISSLVKKSNSSVCLVLKKVSWEESNFNSRQEKHLSDTICDLQKENMEPTDSTHAFFDDISSPDTVSASDSLSEYEDCEQSRITDLGTFSCLKKLFTTNIFTKSRFHNVEGTGCHEFRIESFQTTRFASGAADVNCKVDESVLCQEVGEKESYPELRREVSGITRIGFELFPTESDGVDVVECSDDLFSECVDDLSIDPFKDETHTSMTRDYGEETKRNYGEYTIGISRRDYVCGDEDYLLPTIALLTNFLNQNFVS